MPQNLLLIVTIIAILLLVAPTGCTKFEVFACGQGNKLGIGETRMDYNAPIKKVILPESVKSTKILRFSSSETTHAIETPDGHFIFGLNENKRLSHSVVSMVLNDIISSPAFLPKNYSLGKNAPLKYTYNQVMINLNDFTFSLEADVRETSQLKRLVLSGLPKDLYRYVDLDASSRETPTFPYDPHVWQRSLHNRAFLDVFQGALGYSQFFIQTQRLPVVVTANFRKCPQEISDFSCENLKVVSYQFHQLFLQRNMKLYLENSHEYDVPLDDPRIVGLPTYKEEFLRGIDTSKSPNVVRTFSNVNLVLDTGEEKFKYFKNVITGWGSSIAITKDNKILSWGMNICNMLNAPRFSGTYSYPPRFTNFPNVEEIKQISIGTYHTLVLLHNSTVLGIGCNNKGEFGRNDSIAFLKLTRINFNEEEENCLKDKTCTVEMVAAEDAASFFVFNYDLNRTGEKHVRIVPMCFGKSHLDLNVCSGNGVCLSEDHCECFAGYFGKDCDFVPDCSKFNNCSNGNGYCLMNQTCSCLPHATGENCSIPICGDYLATDAKVCSRHGECVFEANNFDAKCECKPGFKGKFCAEGIEDLLLFAAGESSEGQTGTGQFSSSVKNFTRISFKNVEVPAEKPTINFFSHDGWTGTFMVNNKIFLFGGNTAYRRTVAAEENVFYGIPFTKNNLRVQGAADIALSTQTFAVKDSTGKWKIVGRIGLNSELTYFSETIVPQSSESLVIDEVYGNRMLFLADGLLFFVSDGSASSQITISEGNTIVRLAKFCVTANKNLFCLNRKGEVFIFDEISRTIRNKEEWKKFTPVIDIECVGDTILILKNKNGTYSQGSFNQNGHLGHKTINVFTEVKFEQPGFVLDTFSIGPTHSLVMMKSLETGKKSLFAIGENYASSFGFEDAPQNPSIPFEVPLEKLSIPVEKITNVLATHQNSFIGSWSDPRLENPNVCYGIPGILTEYVCNAHGKCINSICNCEPGFKNYEGVGLFHQGLIRIHNFLFGIFEETPKKNNNFFSTIPETNNCEITEARIAEIDIVYTATTSVALIAVSCLIVCFVLISCGLFVCGVLGFCIFVVFPGFSWCLKFRVKAQRKKEKDELLQGLLQSDKNSSFNTELDESDGELQKMDLSFFNLDFNDYKIDKEIGAGGSGALCFVAIDKKTNEHVFMKMFVMKKNEETGKYEMKEFENEVKLFTRLRHTNIVNFYGFFCAPPSRVGYVCEFCSEGTLASLISSLGTKKETSKQNFDVRKPNYERPARRREDEFDMQKKINFIIQISKGMRYLHQKGIIFRDLKPENILIGLNNTLKITDFGISKIVNGNTNQNMTIKAGTSLYMAPEVTQGQNYDQKVDVFSFGIMIFDILFETVEPYGPNPPFGIDYKISQDPNYRPVIPQDLTRYSPQSNLFHQETFDSLISLMKKCWDHEPQNRPDFKEIVLILAGIEEQYSFAIEQSN